MPIPVERNPIEPNPYKADCTNCFGLCCVALPFAASADFAFTKDSGVPCTNLQEDFRCGIHQQLREKGFRGCTVYDCFGAGQKISQTTYQGVDWRNNPISATEMFRVLPVMQQLHEMLYYLAEALNRNETKPIHHPLKETFNEIKRVTELEAQEILALDISHYRAIANKLFLQTSELVRGTESSPSKKARKTVVKSDMMGAKLKKADLHAANLRGVFLIAADLRGADLRKTDFIGADLRDADLSGADLTGSIFLTQVQINSANGDVQTKLPAGLTIPHHWKKNERPS